MNNQEPTYVASAYDDCNYELCKHWRKSDKLEDKIKLANNGDEADIDDLMKDPRWSQCKEIKKAAIVLYGDDKYLDKLVHDPDEDIRAAVASKWRSKDLDILVHDPSVKVRKAVAAYADSGFFSSKYFDVLVNDESVEVRLVVADKVNCYGSSDNPYLDILVHDPSVKVRLEVALKGFDHYLDALVSDKAPAVREMVARKGKPRHLNKLVKDPEASVRLEVAKRGRDRNLEKLVHDRDERVREFAIKQVRDKDLQNLKEMQKAGKINQTADLEKIADLLPEWRESSKPEDKAMLVRYGRDYDLAKLTRAKSIWQNNAIVMKAIAELDN